MSMSVYPLCCPPQPVPVINKNFIHHRFVEPAEGEVQYEHVILTLHMSLPLSVTIFYVVVIHWNHVSKTFQVCPIAASLVTGHSATMDVQPEGICFAA
jgi:hypothetical protein